MAEVNIPPVLIFFPPVPPPLGAPIVRPRMGRLGESTAPPELAAYVNETFYAPLSSLLIKHELSARMRRRLDDYRAMRDNLVGELEMEWARLREADPNTRQRALAALAQKQAPQLTELDAVAEELRRDLVDGFYGWFAQRRWALGDPDPRSFTQTEVAEVMQAYAFFHKGLLPAQRALLREIALGILATTETVPGRAKRDFFFSPELARMDLSQELPPAVAERIAKYRAKKAELKSELYEAVLEQEKAHFLRGNTLKSWSPTQTNRLAELEKLAEEIRLDLAEVPNFTRPNPPSSLPPVLAARVAAVVRGRAALRAETEASIQAIHRQTLTDEDRPIIVSYRFEADRLTFGVTYSPGRRKSLTRGTERTMEAASLAMATLADTYRARLAESVVELDGIRREIAGTAVHGQGTTPEATLAGAVREAEFNEETEGYRDYRIAMFEPGFSLEQRRLLFGHALEELRLPLPPGDLQPTKRR
jgi:hypothetical protein